MQNTKFPPSTESTGSVGDTSEITLQAYKSVVDVDYTDKGVISRLDIIDNLVSNYNHMELLRDRRLLLCREKDAVIEIRNSENGDLEQQLKGHTGTISLIREFQQHLVTVDTDHVIKVWAKPEFDCVATLVGHVKNIIDVIAFQGQLFSLDQKHTLIKWYIEDERPEKLVSLAFVVTKKPRPSFINPPKVPVSLHVTEDQQLAVFIKVLFSHQLGLINTVNGQTILQGKAVGCSNERCFPYEIHYDAQRQRMIKYMKHFSSKISGVDIFKITVIDVFVKEPGPFQKPYHFKPVYQSEEISALKSCQASVCYDGTLLFWGPQQELIDTSEELVSCISIEFAEYPRCAPLLEKTPSQNPDDIDQFHL